MGDIETVKGAYEAFAIGDITTVLAAMQPDIVWTTVDAGPVKGTHKGHEELVGFFGSLLEHYLPFQVTPDSFTQDGDRVIVLGRHVFENGDTIRFAHVFTMTDGKAAAFDEYVDSAALVAHQK